MLILTLTRRFGASSSRQLSTRWRRVKSPTQSSTIHILKTWTPPPRTPSSSRVSLTFTLTRRASPSRRIQRIRSWRKQPSQAHSRHSTKCPAKIKSKPSLKSTSASVKTCSREIDTIRPRPICTTLQQSLLKRSFSHRAMAVPLAFYLGSKSNRSKLMTKKRWHSRLSEGRSSSHGVSSDSTHPRRKP